MAVLSDKMAAALSSRDRRLIRRHLPEPPSDSLGEIDFTSNDYLSLSTSQTLRNAVLSALAASPRILGSGGSRLLVPAQPHVELESRLHRFFGAEAALLFNSGFDANVGFFSAIPQPGDVVLYDAHIHASVYDGMHLSRLTPDSFFSFQHNSVSDLRLILSKLIGDREGLKEGNVNVFVAVESLYSMDGTIAPLTLIVESVEEMLPMGNGYIIVDEAHATGIYGPNGRGLVVDLGLEERVFARLHTFGKALAASGAVLLTTNLAKDYLLNYARSLIYTTTLSFANIVAVNCSFDLLEDGTAQSLSTQLLALSTYFVDLLRAELDKYPSWLLSLPGHLTLEISPEGETPPPRSVSPWETDPHDERTRTHSGGTTHEANTARSPRQPYPTPIIPVLTSEPRALSSFLRAYATTLTPATSPAVVVPEPVPDTPASTPPPPSGPPGRVLHTKPIYPPTVPKGTARVRVCLHAAHTREDVALLVRGIVAWADTRMAEERARVARREMAAREVGVETWMAAKL